MYVQVPSYLVSASVDILRHVVLTETDLLTTKLRVTS